MGTWSGRILIVNTLVFIWMAVTDGSLLFPSEEMLRQAGAKDPVLIANGEWWRFLTPVFVHIGIIHFAFNSIALKIIGAQVEHIIKWRWFLLIYLLAGIAGNISSSLFNVSVGAGASGAIFGLLGTGLIIERIVARDMGQTLGRKISLNAYTSMAILNLVLGFVIPGIDNAAHLGGFVVGMLLTLTMLWTKQNRLVKSRRGLGVVLFIGIISSLVFGASFATNKSFVVNRLALHGDEAKSIRERYYQYTRALQIDDQNSLVRFKRGKLLILAGETDAGIEDLLIAANDAALESQIMETVKNLEYLGKAEAADRLREKLFDSKTMLQPEDDGD
jgi:membrane associated rhomboid family serine protease